MSALGMLYSFKSIITREILLAVRTRQWVDPLIFFMMVTTLFPLSIQTHFVDHQMAPSIIWIAFLLAYIISLDFSFRADFDQGVFEQWILSPQPLWFLLLSKGLAHWVVHAGMLVMMAPLVGIGLNLLPAQLIRLTGGLLIGTPIFSMLGLITVSLTVGLKNSGLLLNILVVPLTIPVFILGVGTVEALDPAVPFALLGAGLSLSITFAPLIAAFGLKTSVL